MANYIVFLLPLGPGMPETGPRGINKAPFGDLIR